MSAKRLSITLIVLLTALQTAAAQDPDHSNVPGVIIDYSPASSERYLGSPSLVILPNGEYVASHDYFGPSSTQDKTRIFRSQDRGRTWDVLTDLQGQWWSNLFLHRGDLYIMGTSRHEGDVVIRRSINGGRTWTQPDDQTTGLLTIGGGYHCAPVPVVEHNGRLWRAMEDVKGQGNWGTHFRSFMLSVPADADLLDASNWTWSNRVPRNPAWLDGAFGGWLEGNAVVTPGGEIVNILRAHYRPDGGKAAIIEISQDGRRATFDARTGFIDFPGGSKKFTIRFDSTSGLYWSLSNYIQSQHKSETPDRTRNTMALISSPDLKHWTIRSIILYHPDVTAHAFQYPDWQFEDDDMIIVSRTAYDDGIGGAHNQHDANYMTFHRLENFRNRTMNDPILE